MSFTLLKNRLLLFAAASMVALGSVKAQTADGRFGCGTDKEWQNHVEANPSLVNYRDNLEQSIMTRHFKQNNDTIRVIPVVFHIIHNYGPENIDRQKVYDEIKELNEDYSLTNKDTQSVRAVFRSFMSNCKIQFRLAQKDPNGNCTDGIERIASTLTYNTWNEAKSLSQWDPSRYLNVWVIASINNGGQPGTILGFSQFPWDNNKSTDGIVMRADQVGYGNKTLTHEIGHYFGLFHTFETYAGGSDCGKNCSTGGDHVCDTPPTVGPTYGCPPGQNTCTSDPYDDMLENFMDYSSCIHMFTKGQKDRMDLYMNSLRANLFDPTNLAFTGVDGSNTTTYCKPKADFYPNIFTICEGGLVTFFDNSSNTTITNYQWTFDGGSPAVSSSKQPIISFSKAGTYSVKLKVSNPAGTDEVEKTAIINVLPAVSSLKSPVVSDFEDPSQVSDWSFNQDTKGVGWKRSAVAAVSGTYSLSVNNLYGTSGNAYYFTLPGIDMTTVNDRKLTFKLASAQVSSVSYDQLQVLVSSNCGQGFAAIYTRIGKALATVTDYRTSSFVPVAGEWRDETIDLSGYSTVKNLMIRFSLKNKGGNNVYIDDINVGLVHLGINSPETSDALFEVFPNPATDGVAVTLHSPDAGLGKLEIYDVAGRRLLEIENAIFGGNSEPLKLSREKMNISSGGLYYVRVSTSAGSYLKKIVLTE